MTDITKEVIKDAKAVGFKFNWNQEYVFPPSPLRTEQLTKFAALQRQRETGSVPDDLKEAIKAIANDGWLYHGVEGMSEAQQKLYDVYMKYVYTPDED